jgi:CRISPR/Cas system CSM-associated protein Csm4 (group 5 of RAMP superfamily)
MAIERKWYDVTLTLVEPMLGTKPKNKAVYSTYIADKAKALHPEKEGEIDAEVEDISEIEDKGWTGFSEDAEGYFIYDYQVKGFFKEVGNALREELEIGRASCRERVYRLV